MAEDKLILKLTSEQQKQIKDATGKSVSQLTIGFRAAGFDISEQDLDKVVGGGSAFEIKDFSFGVENTTTIGSATGGAGAGKIKFDA